MSRLGIGPLFSRRPPDSFESRPGRHHFPLPAGHHPSADSTKKHHVKCSLQLHELTRAGTSMDFEIYADGEKIGRIVIGRGSLSWFGKGRVKGKRLSWSRFAEMMDRMCYEKGRR